MTPDSLVEQTTSAAEIADLFKRYAVAVANASLTAQSADGRYVEAYTAGFLLAKIAIRAAGYRVKGGDNHRDTLSALPWLIGSDVQSSVDALDVAILEQLVRAWIAENHPELVA